MIELNKILLTVMMLSLIVTYLGLFVFLVIEVYNMMRSEWEYRKYCSHKPNWMLLLKDLKRVKENMYGKCSNERNK